MPLEEEEEEEEKEEEDSIDDDGQYYRGMRLDSSDDDDDDDDLDLADDLDLDRSRRNRSQTMSTSHGRHSRHRQKRVAALVRAANRRTAEAHEKHRVFTIFRILIASDPTQINRPEAEGLEPIEIAILCEADAEVVHLLRKCSEAHWKRAKAGATTTTKTTGQELVDGVVTHMVERGIVRPDVAAAAEAPSPHPPAGSAPTVDCDDPGLDCDAAAAARGQPPLRRGNAWWRRRKRATLSDYLGQSFQKRGPLLLAAAGSNSDRGDHLPSSQKGPNHKTTKTVKTTARTKSKNKTPKKERAYAKYDVPPNAYERHDVPPTVSIDSHVMVEGIAPLRDDDRDHHHTAKMVPFEPHPYYGMLDSDLDSVHSASSSFSSSDEVSASSGALALKEDDRNTYRAVTA